MVVSQAALMDRGVVGANHERYAVTPELLQRVGLIARDRARRAEASALDGLRSRYETLTAREREVMGHVVRGLMNKQVAGELGLSEITVKIHRGSVMRKMGVRTLADLVRQAEALGLPGG